MTGDAAVIRFSPHSEHEYVRFTNTVLPPNR
ncbi:hypothetical protein BTHI11S_01783 [Bosea thiooxidans]